MKNHSILIIGKPKSSKTTYLAQFFTVARKAKSAVTFWKTPENIQPLLDALSRLRKGEETQSTPADQNLLIVLPVTINNVKLELKCPDYGGEQIRSIMNQREISLKWRELILDSSSWIIFIRPSAVDGSFDLSNKSFEEYAPETAPAEVPAFKMGEQANILEMIQFFLHVKRINIQQKITDPKLTIALTCWDEITSDVSPNEYFSMSMPMLDQFLKANWGEGRVSVMGVSAQGFDLNSQENKDKYMDEGPEKFSFVVAGDKTERVNDLTLLLAQAI